MRLFACNPPWQFDKTSTFRNDWRCQEVSSFCESMCPSLTGETKIVALISLSLSLLFSWNYSWVQRFFPSFMIFYIAPPVEDCVMCGRRLVSYHSCSMKLGVYIGWCEGCAENDSLLHAMPTFVQLCKFWQQAWGIVYMFGLVVTVIMVTPFNIIGWIPVLQFNGKGSWGDRHCLLWKTTVRTSVFPSKVILILSMINFLHRNHAWVSFECFAEAYSNVFCVPKENGA